MRLTKLDRAVIVGHSMGGSVAWQYALDHPEKILCLVLIGPDGMRFITLTALGTFKDAFNNDPEVAVWMAENQPDYIRHFTQSMLWANVSSPGAGVDVVAGKDVFWAGSFMATSPSNTDRTVREFTKMAKYIKRLGGTAHICTNGNDDNI